MKIDPLAGKLAPTGILVDVPGLITTKLDRKLFEVPVGFKWFVSGLLDGSLGFGGEESAGSVFLRLDGTVWTTDKDGIVPCLLAAEMTARTGHDPAASYREFRTKFGDIDPRILWQH